MDTRNTKKYLDLKIYPNKSLTLFTLIIEPTWLRLKVYSNNKKQYLSIISRGKSVNVGNFLNIKELSDLARVIKKGLIKRENHLSLNV